MRYIVVGAGAIGGAIGAALSGRGQQVVLVARGDQFEAIRSDGLRLRTPTGESVHRLEVHREVRDARPTPGDVVVVATKGQDTAAALDALRSHAPADVPVLCAQNGVENERLALRLFRNVYGVYVDVPSEFLVPGSVEVRFEGPYGILDLGRYPGGVDGVARRVVRDLRAAGFASVARPDIMRWKHGKLLATLGNSLRAVSGMPPHYRRILERVQGEAEACFAAAGIEAATEGELAERRKAVPGHQGGHGIPGSGYQSLARRTGRIETDYLNGEVVLLGRLHGVPTPINEALQGIAHDAARARRAPASLDIRLAGRRLVVGEPPAEPPG